MTNNLKIITLIPARLKSSRLPEKALIDVNGKTLIRRVYEEAVKLGYPTYCCIDAESIAKEVESFGGKYIMTDPSLPSGSDRCYQALKIIEKENNETYDIIINFQGDSLNVSHKTIKAMVELLIEKKCDLTTCAVPMHKEDYNNPTMVKIAMEYDKNKQEGNCLYFSRSLIPFDRDNIGTEIFHHVGIYIYTNKSLEAYVKAPEGRLEKIEKLEQLRALSLGMTIWAKYFDEIKIYPQAPVDINTPEELEACRKYFK